MVNLEERTLDNGVRVHHIITEKFKTIDVHVFVHQILSRETVTLGALLPRVLRRGCDGFPTTKDINRKLDEMYNASLGDGVLKIGDRQIIHFNLQVLDPKFCPDKSVLESGLELLSRIMLKPVRKNGGLSPEYVAQEKKILKQDIEALINDKYHYSLQKCVEETARGDPYSLNELGDIKDLDSIHETTLSDYHHKLMTENPMEIFVVGNVEADRLTELLNKTFGFPRRDSSYEQPLPIMVRGTEPRVVVERQHVTQGKLCLGCTTGINASSDDFYPMVVYDGILGGYVHSKLFENVREKASLAYYAQSFYVPSKGLVFIASGIEPENYEKALDIIRKQMDDMRDGNFSDREFSFTIKALSNRYRSLEDSPGGMVINLLNLKICGRRELPWEQMDQVNKVVPDRVRDVAQRVTLDTIYFLTREREEVNAG